MPKKRKLARSASSAVDFNHAMVYVHDVARALGFYSDLLGLKVIETYRHGGHPVYARLRSPRGNGTLALHLVEPGMSVPSGNTIRLYFEVEGLDRTCQRLQAEGVRIAQAPKLMPWGWKHAYLNDPDGHEISLYWAGGKRLHRTLMSR
jgi:catechol 2,3-dioxygenase-like lactoylglutathione lyase family enzyme